MRGVDYASIVIKRRYSGYKSGCPSSRRERVSCRDNSVRDQARFREAYSKYLLRREREVERGSKHGKHTANERVQRRE